MYGRKPAKHAQCGEVRRCWKKMNLFPQAARGANGNLALRTKFPSRDELLRLRPCWPTAWNDVLPSAEELEVMWTQRGGIGGALGGRGGAYEMREEAAARRRAR